MTTTQTPQDANEGTIGAVASTAGLERMFWVEKFDHPDLVGGIVWADCELAWINERITLAILAEREACAMACLEMQNGWCSDDHIACADAIRMRSNVEVTGAARLYRAASAWTAGLGNGPQDTDGVKSRRWWDGGRLALPWRFLFPTCYPRLKRYRKSQ